MLETFPLQPASDKPSHFSSPVVAVLLKVMGGREGEDLNAACIGRKVFAGSF